MPLLALSAAQNSMRISKSRYESLLIRKPPVPRSATIAPSSARQFASPTRWKFSRPLSPSMSVCQPMPGRCNWAHAATPATTAAAATSMRFMFFLLRRVIKTKLERPYLDLAPLDRPALRALRAAERVLQRERARAQIHLLLVDIDRLHAVQPHRHAAAPGGDLVGVPLAAGAIGERHRHGGDIDDRARAVPRIGPRVPDVDLV